MNRYASVALLIAVLHANHSARLGLWVYTMMQT